MTTSIEQEVWQFLHEHLNTVFAQDVEGYRRTTSEELSLYEWFVTPHRQDGLDFHFFMIENGWAGTDNGTKQTWRYDLLEPRLQLYGQGQDVVTAVVTYSFMLSRITPVGIRHRTHNESRVLVKQNGRWQVVHVHKSPSWQAPHAPS